MTNPHATLEVASPIFLPSEAETSEVIQKQGIRHTFGSTLLAPFSFLFLLLLRLFNTTVRCSLIAFQDARRRLAVVRGMKQDIMPSLNDMAGFKTFWDPSVDVEISPARSAMSHTDLRLMSPYATFLEKLKEDLFKDCRIAKTIQRSDWAWELRCIIGLRAVEDLALTVIAQGIGKRDHRDFDGTYEELIQLYISTPRPLLQFTETDLAYLANSPVRQIARDYIHPKLEETKKIKELNHVSDYLEEKAGEEGGGDELVMYQKFMLFVKEGH